MSQKIKPIPYRIRIGVIGHRTLDNKDLLYEKVKSALNNEVFKLFDDSSIKLYNKAVLTPKTYSVVTPLAEGADRLIAKVILDYDKDSTIQVVLPLTLADYKNTFINTDDKEFEELLYKARSVISLKMHDISSEPSIIDIEDTTQKQDKIHYYKRKAYKKAGKFVVDNCDLLIAIWDGQEGKGKGGTKDTINYARIKQRPLIIISTNIDETVKIEKGNGLNADEIKEIEYFNTYNISEKVYLSYINNKYSDLFGKTKNKFNDDEKNDIEDSKDDNYDNRNLIKEKILPYYVKASILSKKNQKKFKFAEYCIYIASTIAISAIIIGLIFKLNMHISHIIEFICLAIILIVYIIISKVEAHKAWIDNRFITERLRTSIFFAAIDLEIASLAVPPYMGFAHKSNDWMVQLVNEIWNQLPRMKGISNSLFSKHKDFIIQNWLENQIDYHNKKSKKSKKLNTLLFNLGWVMFIIAMMIPLIHIFYSYLPDGKRDEFFENILTFFTIVFPAIGAVIVGIKTHGDYERNELRSDNMSEVLVELKDKFKDTDNENEFANLMYEADELILKENQDWLMLLKLTNLEIQG